MRHREGCGAIWSPLLVPPPAPVSPRLGSWPRFRQLRKAAVGGHTSLCGDQLGAALSLPVPCLPQPTFPELGQSTSRARGLVLAAPGLQGPQVLPEPEPGSPEHLPPRPGEALASLSSSGGQDGKFRRGAGLQWARSPTQEGPELLQGSGSPLQAPWPARSWGAFP